MVFGSLQGAHPIAEASHGWPSLGATGDGCAEDLPLVS